MNIYSNIMNSTRPDDVFWLENKEHFDLLSDSTRLEIIELLLSPRSVADLAERMGVPRTRLYHHVNLMEDAGMIRVVETRPAGAQQEKVYQVAAYSFQPSKEYLRRAVPRDQARAIITSIFAATEADFVRSVEEGLVTLEDRKDARTILIRRGLMMVDAARLDEFIGELEALYARYDNSPDDLEAPFADDLQAIATVSLVYPSSRRIR
jgi:DNA-binding transcriptional ArsR family regulator